MFEYGTDFKEVLFDFRQPSNCTSKLSKKIYSSFSGGLKVAMTENIPISTSHLPPTSL